MTPYLDEAEHRYWDRDTGRELAGVTETLGGVGIRTDYAGIPDHVIEHAAVRSRAAHLATVYWDDGTLDPASVDPEVQPYLDAWIAFRQETGFEPVHAELLVHSERDHYAGTLDRTGHVPRPDGGRRPVLLDIKGTYQLPHHVGPQTAAYALAYEEMGHEPIAVRWCVRLQKTGKYQLVALRDADDYAVWRAALCVRRWREAHDPQRRRYDPDRITENVRRMAPAVEL